MILDVETPRGNPAKFAVRPDTNDANLVFSLVGGPGGCVDEYGLGKLQLDGWAVDIGAHIGAVTVALLLDNPELRVLAVEPVPDNLSFLHENLRLNDVDHRVDVFEGAATRPGVPYVDISWNYQRWQDHDPAYIRAHRFIGNQYRDKGARMSAARVPAVSLGKLVDEVGRISFLKLDAEGAEWDVLDTPSVRNVDLIRGETHCGYENETIDWEEPTWQPGMHRCLDMDGHLRRLLEETHVVDYDREREIFTATLRTEEVIG